MCGIVGLMVRNQKLASSLGKLMLPMFNCMAERGPDSAGLAVFHEPLKKNLRRYNLFAPSREFDWTALARSFKKQTGSDCEIEPISNHAILISSITPEKMRAWLTQTESRLLLLSTGKQIDIYKDMGDPKEIARRYNVAELSGTHGVGHTRMATESAVSPAHAHPYTAGEDFCLVHNGSVSNPYMLRRKLEAQGLKFETDNDTEAACRFIEWRLREGDDINKALSTVFREVDGFYTLLIATADRLTLVRDAFACKPAVVAEAADYVAVASEFRSLAHLPGIQNAKIYEPLPEETYSWKL
ncbi:MAG TPA: amidophosphoribosyltransferase [Planctomycetota bacterium]|nr:amidophosphoribosyltransferase [Planctomycetota bacterium]